MNRFRKISIIMMIMEVLLMVGGNIILINKMNTDSGRMYRIECKRLTRELEERINRADNESYILENLDLSHYKTIVGVQKYDSEKYCNDDYVVESINGELYQIKYRYSKGNQIIYIVNGILLCMFLITMGVLMYIDKKVLSPFHNMQKLTLELAKGNLTAPIKEEKNKFFGQFLWGMNMLRENIEEKKEKELQLQRERKTLILSLSHDIKTPLSAIDLYAKALSNGLYDTIDKQKEAYSGIQNNAEKIKKYVNEITNASREDFLNLEVENDEFYLQELLTKVVAYYSEKLSVKHTDFIVEEVADCMIYGDRERLVEVLQNIFENAIKYGDGNYIRISFDEEEDCKLITVSNTGNTPTEDELPQLCDSFYRGSNHGNEKGSGLGLYICKNLMKKMDGDVFIKLLKNQFIVTIVVRKA